ncbi:hypothetical protein BCR33DRAFT_711119 [Rhizoclosmatium globosum]|uniref:PAH2 domain-containing protein n=1 Tax=Rhizoclosmatium globosum TaxID=329046 RepID=A0A1Y2D3S5_9FUNG|nr:hypothetical protein BCR33DRAFT_711119 [Rhizoclosmatium globosum]|eukprot:ORY53756.1 hypothetical protein BCR33DRAFT_711119 [Rhizoclosmatium globosum]
MTSAIDFMSKVRQLLHNDPDSYNTFLDTIRMMRSKEGAELDVNSLDNIITILQASPDLILKFNMFLPAGYRIDPPHEAGGRYVIITPTSTTKNFENTAIEMSPFSEIVINWCLSLFAQAFFLCTLVLGFCLVSPTWMLWFSEIDTVSVMIFVGLGMALLESVKLLPKFGFNNPVIELRSRLGWFRGSGGGSGRESKV